MDQRERKIVKSSPDNNDEAEKEKETSVKGGKRTRGERRGSRVVAESRPRALNAEASRERGFFFNYTRRRRRNDGVRERGEGGVQDRDNSIRNQVLEGALEFFFG